MSLKASTSAKDLSCDLQSCRTIEYDKFCRKKCIRFLNLCNIYFHINRLFHYSCFFFSVNYVDAAFVPYPFAYSFVIDQSCILWEESCHQRGNCWIYDLSALNGRLHGMPVITCAINCLCIYGIYLFANETRLARFYEDDDDDRDSEDRDMHQQRTEERGALKADSFVPEVPLV